MAIPEQPERKCPIKLYGKKREKLANTFFFLFASIIFRARHFFFFDKKAKILHEPDVQTKVLVPQKLMLDQISVCYCQRRLMLRGRSE